MTKILTWNIRQGGGSRLGKILSTIDGHAADVIVLTEFRNNRQGQAIQKYFTQAGFTFTKASSAVPTQNSILIASKAPPLACSTCEELGSESFRCLRIEYPSFYLLGCYFAQKQSKLPLWKYIVAFAKTNINRPCIVLGDFNTGKHYEDETGKTFYCSEWFERLIDTGWTDAWRYFATSRQEYTWFSRSGNGFRIDHAFVSPPMLPFLSNCSYSHEERKQGISDHSALLVELDLALDLSPLKNKSIT